MTKQNKTNTEKNTDTSAETTPSPAEILEAINSCRDEIIKNPESAALYIKLAELHELDDNQAEAIHAYQTATKKDPTHLEGYYRLGLIKKAIYTKPCPTPLFPNEYNLNYSIFFCF